MNKRFYPLLVSVLYLTILISYHYLAVWSEHFAQPGLVYLAGSLLKLAFIPFFMLILASVGRFLLTDAQMARLGPEWTHLDVLAMRGLFGAGVTVIAVFLLGFAGLYRFWAFLMLTAPFVYLGTPILKASACELTYQFQTIRWKSFEAWVMSVILAVLFTGIVDVYIRNVNVPLGYFDGDVQFSYFPFYRELVETTHSWWPSSFHQFFFSKGSGIQVLPAVLLDPMAASLGSLVLFFFSAFALYRMALRLTTLPSLAAFALLLYCMSRMTHNLNFFKPHIGLSSWIILWIAFLALYWRTLPEVRTYIIPGGLASILGLVVFQPIYVFLALALLLWMWVGARLCDARFGRRQVMTLVVSSVFVFAAMIALNSHYTGVQEISFDFFVKHIDLERFSRYMYPTYAKVVVFLHTGDGGVDGSVKSGFSSLSNLALSLNALFCDFTAFSDWIAVGWTKTLLLLIFLVALTLVIASSVRNRLSNFQDSWLLLGAEVICLIVFLVLHHAALTRAFYFTSGLYALSVALLASAIIKIFPGSMRRNAAAVLSIVLLLFVAQSIRRDILVSDWRHYLKPLTGEWSYSQYQEYSYPTLKYVEVQKQLPADIKCLAINSRTGALTIPNSKFEMFLYNHFMHNLPIVLYGSPKQARVALERHGVKYIAISTNSELDGIVLSPFLRPENIGAYWSVVCQFDDLWLLAWREEGQPPLPDDFLQAYQNQVEKLSKRSKDLYELSRTQQ